MVEDQDVSVAPSAAESRGEKRLIVRGKFLVTGWAAETAVITGGAVYAQAGTVRDTGPYEVLRRRYPGCDVVGDGTHLVMPGFVNGHSHGRGVTTLRQGIPDEPGELRALGLHLGLTVDPYWDVLLASARQLEGGITATMHSDSNFGFGPPELYEARLRKVITAYADSGIRFSVALAMRDKNSDAPYLDNAFLSRFPQEVQEEAVRWRKPVMQVDQYLDLYARLCVDFQGVVLQLEPVRVNSCSDEFLVAFRREAAGRKARIHLHLLETAYQKAHALQKFGKTGVDRLADIGFLGPDVTCAHCVWVTEHDIQLLRDTRAIVVHNPSANLRLRSGLAPIQPMAAAGVPIAVGTDNLGLNDNEDILQEVRLAQLLHSPPGLDQSETSPRTTLLWSTEGGARAVGVDRVGRLEAGSPADLVMARVHRFEKYISGSIESLAASVVQWVRQTDIDQVMVGGRIVVRGGRYVLQDRDDLEEKAYMSRGQWSLSPAAQAIKERIAGLYRNSRIVGQPYYELNSRH